MELYNAQTMPLSNDPKLKAVQEKILRGEQQLNALNQSTLTDDSVIGKAR